MDEAKPHFVYKRARPTNKVMRGRYGNKFALCKLVDEQIAEIRRRYETGAITQQALADEYGVHRSAIGFICSGRTYRYVPQ